MRRTSQIDLPEAVQMTNGGTGPLHSKLVFVNSGRGPIPPSLVLVDPTVLLDNFFGRQFNSLDDIKIHPKTGKWLLVPCRGSSMFEHIARHTKST
uniref:Phospholipid-transporting ATPase (EC) n=1 Tax=Ganoderma boninense TaxID=34458 RepID=A0A5K1K285_9APHY|nr:Phospholipid-transporting ATPase (EC [Ganoderma boninense]